MSTFNAAAAFNQDIGKWNVASATTLYHAHVACDVRHRTCNRRRATCELKQYHEWQEMTRGLCRAAIGSAMCAVRRLAARWVRQR